MSRAGLGREVCDEEIGTDPRFARPDYGLPDEAPVAAIRTAALRPPDHHSTFDWPENSILRRAV